MPRKVVIGRIAAKNVSHSFGRFQARRKKKTNEQSAGRSVLVPPLLHSATPPPLSSFRSPHLLTRQAVNLPSEFYGRSVVSGEPIRIFLIFGRKKKKKNFVGRRCWHETCDNVKKERNH